ncbi:uncharacterized protein LOC117134944 [Drosophila busckii]|uniref:uncharacterized protein LOC117134944 n=1 Tax=Drosophila busckii TaxID=30019 RepID=UPI00143326C8|nr:uncharacterized protein LOC117134944 [Drosophila busckii]
MTKLVLICLLSLALVQCALSENPAEALNQHIRVQLQEYEKFLANDDGSHKEELQKLIKIYESALKTEDFAEKETIVKGVTAQFSAEFGAFVQLQLQMDQLAEDIKSAIGFYKTIDASFKADADKAIADLQAMEQMTDFEAKKNAFLNLQTTFRPEFVEFLKKDSLPKIMLDLQNSIQFFETLLAADANIKFASEIAALKAQAQAAMAENVSIDDKQKALFEITNPSNAELYEFLQKKFIEAN